MSESNHAIAKSFGTELWSQLDQVDMYMATGVEYQLSLNHFLKGYAQAELEYSAQLLKVAKPFRESLAKSKEKWQKQNDPELAKQISVNYSSTVMNAWERLLAQTETIAQLHCEISEVLNKERKGLKNHGHQLQSHTKQSFEKIKTSQNELSKLIDSIEKTQQSYEKEVKVLETCGSYLKKSVKEKKEKDIDKYRLELEKQIAAVKHSQLFYKTAITTANTAKNNHYLSIIPNLLDEMQKEDESTRIVASKSSMVAIARYISSVTPKLTQIWSEFAELATCINENHDSQLLMDAFKINDNPPVDFSYLDSHDTFKKKQNLLTESKYEIEEKEDLAGIQPKVGRKKAGDRIKFIEKEMLDVDKRRQGLIDVIAALKGLPCTEATINEIDALKNDLEIKLNSLAAKKQIFLEYLAELDGKPAPPMQNPLEAISPISLKSESSNSIFKNPLHNSGSMLADAPPSMITNEISVSPQQISHEYSSAKEEIASSKDKGSVILKPEDVSGSVNSFTALEEEKKGSGKLSSLFKLDKIFQKSDQSNQKTEKKDDAPPIMSIATKEKLHEIPQRELEKVRVLYDFEAIEASPEITVKSGMMVEILDAEYGEGWARCRLVDNPTIQGLVPKAYIGK